jgi:hypothetical protein
MYGEAISIARMVGLPALDVGRIAEHEIELSRRKGAVGKVRILRSANDVVPSLALTGQSKSALAMA